MLSGLIPSFERKKPVCFDKSEKSIYHSNKVAESAEDYKKMYEKNSDPEKYNIPVYNIPGTTKIEKGYGMASGHTVETQDSFAQQFEPLGTKTNSLRASNDVQDLTCRMSKWSEFNSQGDDMTLGVIGKDSEEFQNTSFGSNTRMKDHSTPSDFTRVLERFTGENSYRRNKREIEGFFPTSKTVFTDDADNLRREQDIRYRQAVGDKRNGVSLTQPKMVAPRLDLDENQDTILTYKPDLTRVLPPTIDQIRGKKQESVALPMVGGKKGEKRAIIGATEVRKNKYTDKREILADGGTRKQAATIKMKIRKTDRAHTGHVIGIGSSTHSKYDPKTLGKIHNKSKSIYEGHTGIASLNKRAYIDPKSITIAENERFSTEGKQYTGTITGNNRTKVTDRNDKLRGKHILEHVDRGVITKSQGGSAFNMDQKMKGKHILAQENHGQISGHGSMAYGTDDVRRTVKETTVGIEQSGFVGTRQGTYADMQDRVRNTMKQTTASQGREGYISGNYGRAEMQDRVRNTMKQTTASQGRDGYVSGNYGTRAEMQDRVRNTMKQTTASQSREAYMSGNHRNRTVMQDRVRDTNRQTTNQYGYSGPLHQSKNDGYLRNTVQAPLTMRQMCNIDNYTHNVGSSGLNQHNPAITNKYDAKTTMKQLNTRERIGNASYAYKEMDQSQWYNGTYNDVRDDTLINRQPMGYSGTYIDGAEDLGECYYKGNPMDNYERTGNIDLHGNYNPHYNVDVRVPPTYDDRIGLYDMRDPSSYVQKGYYTGKTRPPAVQNGYTDCYDCSKDQLQNDDLYNRGNMTNRQMYNDMYDELEEDSEYEYEYSEEDQYSTPI